MTRCLPRSLMPASPSLAERDRRRPSEKGGASSHTVRKLRPSKGTGPVAALNGREAAP
jgi:hypothetical protein